MKVGARGIEAIYEPPLWEDEVEGIQTAAAADEGAGRPDREAGPEEARRKAESPRQEVGPAARQTL